MLPSWRTRDNDADPLLGRRSRLGRAVAVEAHPGRFADFCELVKARLTALVLVTTLAGFYLGWSGPMDWLRLFNALFGTGWWRRVRRRSTN